MKKSLIAALIIAATAGFAAEAGNAAAAPAPAPAEKVAITGEDTKSFNAELKAAQPISSGMMLDEEFEKFRQELQLPAYGTPNAKGTVYFTGRCSVAVNVASRDFIKSRSSAYEKAYTDAVAQLVMDRFGKEFIKKVRQECADESSDAQDAPASIKDARAALDRKTEALKEAEVDEKLKNLGVDPSTYADKSVAAKKDLYRNSILTSTVRSAFGSAAGCLVVQTFEARAADGTYSIGVVLRSDAVCTEVARCISQKQRPTLSRPSGAPVAESLPTDEEMLTQFGVRLFFDENGEPGLLSFGQWGSNYRGNDSRAIDRANRHAMVQAENMANEQLTQFINSTIRVNESSVRGEDEASQMIFRNDGSKSQEELVNFVDKWSKSSETVGFDSMIGRGTAYRKVLRHPSGHLVAVVVRTWTFGKLDAERSVIQGTTPKRGTPVQPPVNPEGAGIRRGRVYDF